MCPEGCVFNYFTNQWICDIMKEFSLVINRSSVKAFAEAVEFYNGQVIKVEDYGKRLGSYKRKITFEVERETDLYYIGRAVEFSVSVQM